MPFCCARQKSARNGPGLTLNGGAALMAEVHGYKLVRHDYTDCRTGTVRYTVGKTTTLPTADRVSHDTCGVDSHLCYRAEDTMQHSHSQWPVRLLAVASSDVIAQDETKARCGSIFVERECGIASCFGPQGDKVVALLEALAGFAWLKPSSAVTAEQLHPLVEEHLRRLARFHALVGSASVRVVQGWRSISDAAWAAAWAAAWDAARAAARTAAWAAASAAARDAARDAAWAAARAAASGAQHLVVADIVGWPSPWEPLLDLWRLGCWPIGVVRGEFVVYVPEVRS